MSSIEPSPDRLPHFLEHTPDDSPIVMINLLRYREHANYPAGVAFEPCSGREAYARYGEGVLPLLAKAGGKPIWGGAVASTLISPEGESWDDAVLVEYPSKLAFVEMTSSPEYQAIAVHRTASLADSRLIATTSGFSTL